MLLLRLQNLDSLLLGLQSLDSLLERKLLRYQWSQIRRVAPVGNVVGATVKTLSRAVGKWVAPVVKVVCVHAGTRKEVRW